MIARVVSNVLFCEECAPKSKDLLRFGFVGEGSVFKDLCPHVEVAFLKFHDKLKAKESPEFRHLWQPFCIGFMLSTATAVNFYYWWLMP